MPSTIVKFFDRNSRHLLRCFALLLVAASSYQGYFSRWALRDGSSRFGIERMLTGTAERPFVYRQLVPWIVNVAVDRLPESLFDHHVASAGNTVNGIALRAFNRALDILVKHSPQLDRIYVVSKPSAGKREYLKYHLVYLLTFLAFVAALWLLGRCLSEVTGDSRAATLGSFCFGLVFPLFLTLGGYFYDYWELLFFVTAYWLAFRGNLWWLPILSIPATFNKESFIFYLPVLFPLLRARRSALKTTLALGCAVLCCCTINIYIKWIYASNPGAPIEFHLMRNLAFLISPQKYIATGVTYGLPFPIGLNLLNGLALVAIIRKTWNSLSTPVRHSTWIGLALNIPLLLLFSLVDELRVLSMLYVPFAVMLTLYLSAWLKSNYTNAKLAGSPTSS